MEAVMSDEIVFGIHAVNNVLKRSPERVKEMYVQQGRDDERLQQLFTLAKQNGIHVQVVKKHFY